MKTAITISANVTEEIHPKKLFTFLRTQIVLKDIFITGESVFYYTYFSKVKRYEIIFFQYKELAYQFPPFYFLKLNDNSHLPILYIAQNFFSIYIKNKLAVYKEVSNISDEDIVSYVEQTYNIKDLTVIHLDNKKVNELAHLDNKKDKNYIERNIYQVISKNSFQYFLYYSIVVLSVFTFLLYDSYIKRDTSLIYHKNNSTQNILNTQKKLLYKKHQKNTTVKTFQKFIEALKKDSISFQKIEFHKNIFRVELIDKEKNKLLKVLEYPLKNIVLQSIRFDQKSKVYKMDVTFYA